MIQRVHIYVRLYIYNIYYGLSRRCLQHCCSSLLQGARSGVRSSRRSNNPLPRRWRETCHLTPARWTARFVAEITGFQAPANSPPLFFDRLSLLLSLFLSLSLSRLFCDVTLSLPIFAIPRFLRRGSPRRLPRPFVHFLLSTIGMTPSPRPLFKNTARMKLYACSIQTAKR